jgi:hypothetical protein
MIDFNEVKSLLESNSFERIICRNFDMKPRNLAYYIAQLSNIDFDYGYYINGVEILGEKYIINGIDRHLDISKALNFALTYLDNAPKIELGTFTFNNKNILVLKVHKAERFVGIKIESDISKDIDKYLEDVLYSCIQLQSLVLYSDSKENDRNDFIVKILESKGYIIKDQTRRGKSNTGKDAGEVDAYIQNRNGFPFSIIEALKLKSFNSDYVDTHIDKIYKYDTVGNLVNICLTYANVENFDAFWQKYYNHVRIRDYRNKLVTMDENGVLPYSEIRVAKATHLRSGKLTYLYHIAVHFS